MATSIYIPPARELEFLPTPPPFENPAEKRILEIGTGKGEFILHQAQTYPRHQFVGVEIRRGRFTRTAKKAESLGLQNLFMILGDARECITRVFPADTFDQVYILFPDPWPKKRHVKHRLINPLFINTIKKILKKEGEVFSATDAGYYSEQIVESFTQDKLFSCERIGSLFPTYFENKWKALGKAINYWKFSKA